MRHAVRPVKWGTMELVLTQKETLEALEACSMEVNSFSSSLKVMKNIVSADPAFTLVFVHNMRRDGNVVQQKFRTGCSEVNSLWMIFVCFLSIWGLLVSLYCVSFWLFSLWSFFFWSCVLSESDCLCRIYLQSFCVVCVSCHYETRNVNFKHIFLTGLVLYIIMTCLLSRVGCRLVGFTFCPSFSAFPPPSWFIKEASSPQSLELIQSGGLGWLWDGGKRQRAAGVNPSLFCCPAVELLSVESGSETHREFAYGANMSWKRARSGESPISRRVKGRRETSVARWGWAGQCCSHGATAHRHLAGFMTEALMNFLANFLCGAEEFAGAVRYYGLLEFSGVSQ